jgi:hypothetical protein
LATLLWSLPCAAADPLRSLLACRALADETARLACFDRESATLAGMSAGSTVPAPAGVPAPASTASAAAPVPAQSASASASNPTEDFGLPGAVVAAKEVARGARVAEPTRISAHIATVSVSATGQATFGLDNGQIWRQLLSEGDLLARPGEPVTISVGAFHSYWMQLNSGRGCKVARIT